MHLLKMHLNALPGEGKERLALLFKVKWIAHRLQINDHKDAFIWASKQNYKEKEMIQWLETY